MKLVPINIECKTAEAIIADGGQIVENQDGTVSVYMTNTIGLTNPVILSQNCCLRINPNYFFDIDTQKCMWTDKATCSIENPFNIILNPNGNDGSIFTVDNDELCNLNISFDYLFKVKCETLYDLLLAGTNGTANVPEDEILLANIERIEFQIEEQAVLCNSIASQIESITAQISNTPYSIECPYGNGTINGPIGVQSLMSFDDSGFSQPPNNEPPQVNQPYNGNIQGVTFCLTAPEGLSAWANRLGSLRYEQFLNGDENSFNCEDVQYIVDLNNQNITSFPSLPALLYECDTPFDFKNTLQQQLVNLQAQQTECESILTTLNNQLAVLTQSANSETFLVCDKPISMFESLDVSFSIEVITSANTIETVYTANDLFPIIGGGNLYDYLTNTTNSGFYVCWDDNCNKFSLANTDICEIKSNCDGVLDSLLNDLFIESNLSGQTNAQSTFLQSLPEYSFSSNWLNYNTLIDDPAILELIANQKVRIKLTINHTCGDICILLDNIRIEKSCTRVSSRELFVTKSPGFELDRIRDNKKSWVSTDNYRNFEMLNISETNSIRQTNYNVNDDRLVINTKEIDLDINMAAAIETDVWRYIIDNPCLFTGITQCSPCEYKQFQDGESYEFMDEESYEFMDFIFTGTGSEASVCCGDNLIPFSDLVSTTLSSITVVEDFEYTLLSELIDAKNRQTISSYATLRALYDRYINSLDYCDTQSSSFGYVTMEQFANLVGDYWVEIVEQVVPSTTIWSGVKIYTNTIFDQQKFKYREYTSLLCTNPFSGETILSPINGISGQCANVEVLTETISLTADQITRLCSQPVKLCDSICLAQMNHGSEFIGTVKIIGSKPETAPCDDSVINECDMMVSVINNENVYIADVINYNGLLTYSWSNGSTESITTITTPGLYSLTVTDSNCCSYTTKFVVE